MKKIFIIIFSFFSLGSFGQTDLKTLLQLTDEYYNVGGYAIAGQWCDQAQQQLREKGDTNSLVYHQLNAKKGLIALHQAKYLDAEEILNKEEKYFLSYQNDSFYSKILNGQALLFAKLRRYQQSEEKYQKLLQLKTKRLETKDSIIFSSVYNNMGILYYQEFLYHEDKFEKYRKTSDSILKAEYATKCDYYLRKSLHLKKQNNKLNEAYCKTYNNLGSLYLENGRSEESLKIFKHILEIQEKREKKFTITYAYTLLNLGLYYNSVKNYYKAKQYYEEAAPILKYKLGENHPKYLDLQFRLASFYHEQNMLSTAEQYYLKVNQFHLNQLDNYFEVMNENEKIAFFRKTKNRFDQFSSYTADRHKSNYKVIRELFDIQLKIKGALLSSENNLRQKINNLQNQELINKYDSWKLKKEELASLAYLTKKEISSLKRETPEKLKQEISQLEKELNVLSSDFEKSIQHKNIKWRDIYNALNEKEAVVEIIKYHEYDKGKITDRVSYCALVLKKSNRNTLQFLPLPNHDELEKGKFAHYKNCNYFKLKDKKSYNVYWKPIEKALSGMEKVFFSPDGVYHQINLNTLLDTSTNQYLLEKYNISLITNAKDVIEINDTTISTRTNNNVAYLFGRPEYLIHHKNKQQIFEAPVASTQRFTTMVRGANFGDLPGTETEIIQIDSLLHKGQQTWTTHVFLHDKATEEALKGVKSPTLLHIATHGFFIENSDSVAFSVDLNPMLRSGIIMAGVTNYFNEKEKSAEDGILTALEATNLDLNGTSLVVLSACETGLGKIHTGEGVYGMQRAMYLAGARSVLMSLWKVDDEATWELMTNFYQMWRNTGNKNKAFKYAQLKVKEKYKHPYYWGAFIMVGE